MARPKASRNRSRLSVLHFSILTTRGLTTISRSAPRYCCTSEGPFIPLAFPNFQGLNAAQGGVNNPVSVYNLGSAFQGNEKTLEQKTVATASLTWIKDNHTFKTGAEMRIEGYPNYNTQGTTGLYRFSAAETGLPYLNAMGPAGSGGTIGFPYASFLPGLVDNGNIRQLP
jgi:hypothetical protein